LKYRSVMSDDEPVEEVDLDDHVLRMVTRAEMRAGHLRHRCVYLPILDSSGRLLVHRRSPDKDVWPGRWDVAAGGVVGAGEAWSLAAARELAEEVGLLDVVLEPIGSGVYEDDEVRVLGRVYLVRSDGPFTFTDGEVVEARFVDAAELAELRAAAPFCPDSLAIVLPLLAW
jgi:8-oxo-dGTP pyrophosphatase MutT (NUDIX family)